MAQAKKGAKKAAPKKIEKTLVITEKYLKGIYKEVCEDWRTRLESDFPLILGRNGSLGDMYEGQKTGYNYIIVKMGKNAVGLYHDNTYEVVSSAVPVKSINSITVDELVKLTASLYKNEPLRLLY